MALPSFDAGWQGSKRLKPRICVLEVRDRTKPDDAPIASLFVERELNVFLDERDGSVYKASIRISYERIGTRFGTANPGKGCFSGSYSRGFTGDPSASLTSESTSDGAVFLDLPGLEGNRIGTYLMNEIVTWVKQWPESTVQSIELIEGQSQAENRARRNRFYEQFGLVFDYRDPEQCEGLSRPMLAKELTTVDRWKANLTELDIRQYVGKLLHNLDSAQSDLGHSKRAAQSFRDDLWRAKAAPIRWALRQLWHRYMTAVLTSAVLAATCAIAWFEFKAR